MPKINFRIVPASRESISHVQTGAARKPNLVLDLRPQVVLACRTQYGGATFEAGKLVERSDEHPNPKPPKRSSSTGLDYCSSDGRLDQRVPCRLAGPLGRNRVRVRSDARGEGYATEALAAV